MSIFSSSLTITGATGGRGLLSPVPLSSIGTGEGLRGASFFDGDDFFLSTISFLSLPLRTGDLLLPLLLLLELLLRDDVEPLEDDPLLLELLLLELLGKNTQ